MIEPEVTETVEGHRDHLGIRSHTLLTNHIHVPLEVFTEAPLLLPLVTKQLRDRKPSNRLRHGPVALTEDPGQGRCHLRPQGHVSITLVLKMIELANDFLATLLHIQIEGPQWRAVVLLKSIPG